MLKQYNHRLGAGEVVDIRLSLPPYYCPIVDDTSYVHLIMYINNITIIVVPSSLEPSPILY